MNRNSGLPTLRIDTATAVPFRYRGEPMQGVSGDTIATALFANGVRIFSRSLKYHRPRGLYSLDGVCANAMMSVNGVPNLMTETVLLAPGMAVEDQNVKGSAQRDRLGFLDRLDWAMPAGFYYEVMHKPAVVWPLAARAVRAMAGVGVIEPGHETRGRFEKTFLSTEVCVLGGGPAGMQAALAAARTGVRVVLLMSSLFFPFRRVSSRPESVWTSKLVVLVKFMKLKLEPKSKFWSQEVVSRLTLKLVE